LNELFKLVLNTMFGDSVSRYFQTANMIIGSNITAMVRVMMWYTEKGLFLAGSITDGQIFNLNRVVHKRSGKYLNKVFMARLYMYNARHLKDNDICELKPLMGKKDEIRKRRLAFGRFACALLRSGNSDKRKRVVAHTNPFPKQPITKRDIKPA